MTWRQQLERDRQRRFGADEKEKPESSSANFDLSPANHGSDNERTWSNQLERNRRQRLPTPDRLSLPGPGATAAAKAPLPNIGKPLPTLPANGAAPGEKGTKSGGASSSFEPQAPSSIETAKMAAQVASGVGLGKVAAEEMQSAALAAGKGFIATLGAVWQIINKYGPWLLFFGVYSIIFEDPFITTPILLGLLWAWAIGAHWLKIKWLRTFNILEQLALITISSIYMVAFAAIVLLIALIACANDTTCAVEAIRTLGVSDLPI
ncbi:hypothetical protein KKF05_03045 [Patescibacteria group bacterium]|nr:hypothetical protein [Patescibacteria group bacterium]MBU1028773.1 hypothetical protein [Patescibacteria group bacterium]MBU1916241.1 hypothetical protein [Patescibacteria group bacterium]